jgi:hypothetical protein
MEKPVTVWYDPEGDYLEVLFARRAGYFRETDQAAVMEKVDIHGNLLGFSILGVRTLQGNSPFSATLSEVTA